MEGLSILYTAKPRPESTSFFKMIASNHLKARGMKEHLKQKKLAKILASLGK